jgi:SAM-dependent methyltransferase
MTAQALILDQYGAADFVARVEAVLQQAGLGEGIIPWQALAPLDQFHVGGMAATQALAERLQVTPGASILDLGCGPGGPSRALAAGHGATVTGIDINPALIALATMLTRRTGIADRVSHITADATALPFAPESFDLAWTQHVAMNIADRHALYAGVHRVLRPGGRFALYDVVAGNAGPLHFPVPWARDPAASFLLTPDATRAVLEACGFEILTWADVTEAGRSWSQNQAATPPDQLKSLTLPLIMGPDFPARTANLRRNFDQGRARLLQAVMQRR